MKFVLNLESNPDYISLEIFGDKTKKPNMPEIEFFLDKITETCNQNKIFSVMITVHVEKAMPSQGILNIMKLHSRAKTDQQLKIALYFASAATGRSNEFIQFIADNRSLNLSVFDEKDEALAWLLAD